MKHSGKDSDEKGKFMENIVEKRKRIKEKIITGLSKGTKVQVSFGSDFIMKGTVEDVELCSNLNKESWYIVYLNVAGGRYEYDSRMDSEISKCIIPEEEGVFIGKDTFEKYNIPTGLSDSKFFDAVIDNWDAYDEIAKEEIAITMSCSINDEMMKNILDAYVFMRKCYKEDSEKVIKLMSEKTDEIEERLKVLKEKNELEQKYEKLSETFKKSYTGAYLLSLIAEAWKKEERII